jgi:hypothetical protein
MTMHSGQRFERDVTGTRFLLLPARRFIRILILLKISGGSKADDPEAGDFPASKDYSGPAEHRPHSLSIERNSRAVAVRTA